MIVSINQPAYLPWLGYFHRIAISDVHVILDHVQFEKNSFTNRNKIRTKEGWSLLTVPVQTKGKFGALQINELEIARNTNWQKKHKTSIMLNYSKAPFFDEYFPFFESVYSKEWDKLSKLLNEINLYLLKCLGINKKILYSSQLDVMGQKSDLVLNICRKTEATTYLSGSLGRNYLQTDQFEQQHISICYHDYQHPVYKQVYKGFQPHMSIIDLLFNHGDKGLEILGGSMASKREAHDLLGDHV